MSREGPAADAAGKDPLEGTPYRALEMLGRGSMGVVYAAEHRRLRKEVCVKLLLAELTRHPELVDRMRVEAQSLAVLDGHPNLLIVTDFGETASGQPFIAMERLVGRTLLQERKARGQLPVGEAIDLACQILSGLAAAHDKGIIHRDIKPGNLFVCDPRDDGRRVLKILDFGVAKLAHQVGVPNAVAPLAFPTQEGVAVGTPKFFAPEQARGATIDHRVDIYAVGAVLYTLVAGRGPFDHHKDLIQLTKAAVHEVPRPPSAFAQQPIPPALDDAILKALEKRPEDRFADARSFAAELQRVRTAPSAPRRWQHTEIVEVPAAAAVATRNARRATDVVDETEASTLRTPERLPPVRYPTTEPLPPGPYPGASLAHEEAELEVGDPLAADSNPGRVVGGYRFDRTFALVVAASMIAFLLIGFGILWVALR